MHVCSDNLAEKELEITESEDQGIREVIVYYQKVHSKIPFLSSLIKRKRLIAAFEAGYQKVLSNARKPSLIQLNVVMPAGLGVAHLSKTYDIPYVVNEGWTGYTPEDGNYKGAAQKFFTKKVLKAARAIMPVSEDLKNAMLSHGLKGHYFIVPNVVDVDVFKPDGKQNIGSNKFIHISALDDVQKNVSGILRAIAALNSSHPNLQLSVVGEGSHKLALQQLAIRLGIESRVHFKGRLKASELVEEINANNALVMFSNYESFCLAVVETLACGKPVITSRAGGVTNQITNDLGITVAPRDEEGLAAAIKSFSEQTVTYDTNKICKFVSENFSKKIIGAKLNEVYNFALDKQRNH